MKPAADNALGRVIQKINKGSGALLAVAGVALTLMILAITFDVIARSFFGTAITGVSETVQYWFMPLSILFALSYSEWKHEHIRVTLLSDSMTGRPQAATLFAGQLVAVVACGMLAWSSIEAAIGSFNLQETVAMGTGALSIWPIQVGIVVAWIWMFAQTMVHLVSIVFPRIAGKDTQEDSKDDSLDLKGESIA